MSLNVQYGCGLSAPANWLNFDVSPTLRLQRIPLLGRLIKKVNFPSSVLYGDILKGLPGIQANSCDAVYCSHVLEHLSYNDCKLALKNTYDLLKKGAIFRCVLPDLEKCIDLYLEDKKNHSSEASIKFMRSSLLGVENRPRGIKEKTMEVFGNSHHLWMWDKDSLKKELLDAGFSSVRICRFNDSVDENFKQVEDSSRFYAAFSLEAIK